MKKKPKEIKKTLHEIENDEMIAKAIKDGERMIQVENTPQMTRKYPQIETINSSNPPILVADEASLLKTFHDLQSNYNNVLKDIQTLNGRLCGLEAHINILQHRINFDVEKISFDAYSRGMILGFKEGFDVGYQKHRNEY